MKKDPWLLKLGNKIREVRKEHGFSQEAIASEA
ncbi:TPA: transcriptional regulator, partial [Legionella pneumophila]|nr:transcriptional regulator [Legionella pneumophila]